MPTARPVAISGIVFADKNADGYRDSNEAILANYKVFLDANKNGVLDTGEVSVLTNASGAYSFTGLGAGTYSVDYTVPTNFVNTGTKPLTGIVLTAGATSANNNFFAQSVKTRRG